MNVFLEWIKTGLKKRKVKVFLIFLLCSTLAWLINNLSQSYTNSVEFNLAYENIPKEYILASEPPMAIQTRLEAIGFQFLGYGLNNKNIVLDVSKAVKKDSILTLSPEQIKTQIEAQLSKNTKLVDFNRNPIHFDITSVFTKKVPVVANINIELSKNHMIEGDIVIEPDYIEVTGPERQLFTLRTIKTESKELTNVSENFSINVSLQLPNKPNKLAFSTNEVIVSGKVVRFSEKILEVPVSVINLPEDTKVRTFPEMVKVNVQGPLEILKTITSDDIIVEADYKLVSTETGNRLPVVLKRFPETLVNASIMVNEIEFILRKK